MQQRPAPSGGCHGIGSQGVHPLLHPQAVDVGVEAGSVGGMSPEVGQLSLQTEAAAVQTCILDTTTRRAAKGRD